MEYETPKNPQIPCGISEPVTHCDGCDEESICNCENNERVTPYFSDEQGDYDPTMRTPDKKVTERCKKIKNSCQKTIKRIKKDWKACDGKPYIKQKASCRFEVYQSKDDPVPIDSFEAKTSKDYALRTAALVGAGMILTACVIKYLLKK